jgi:hypothetical protein
MGPVLAKTVTAEGFFRVEGGLNYLRGNRAPYFSLTYSAPHGGGAGHDAILKLFPCFADLAALHLSDIDGVPMYAEGNGWYNLAGALGGYGERYHVGNSKRNFPITPAADTPWKTTEWRLPTEAECLGFFARHCRISIEEAAAIRDEVRAAGDARRRWAEIMETMRPRWKAEAEACIAKHKLQIFGDPWSQETK